MVEALAQHFRNSDTVKKDVTFSNAKYETIHRWFPYLEGFSEKFIKDIVSNLSTRPGSIYEPFGGSGTLPVYAFQNDIDIYYSEINPFLQELMQFKIEILDLGHNDKKDIIEEIEHVIKSLRSRIGKSALSKDLQKSYQNVFQTSTYFEEENYKEVLRTKTFINNYTGHKLVKETLKFASCEALLPCSLLKRAGDIRYRKGRELQQIDNFVERLTRNLINIKSDLQVIETKKRKGKHILFPNAKEFNRSFTNAIDLIITSPPYLNGTNYIRNTKLELWFLDYLKEKADLGHYRKLVITSGINDVTAEKKEIAIDSVKELVSNEKLYYDKRIPKMINDYFFDMQLVFNNAYKYLKKGGYFFIDIGDSIYGSVHVKTDEILIELLESSNFNVHDNLLLRDRKSKSGEIVKQCLIIAQK